MSTLLRNDAVLAVEHAAGMHDEAALRDVRLPREIDRNVGDAIVGDVDELQAARGVWYSSRFESAAHDGELARSSERLPRRAGSTSPVGVVGITCMTPSITNAILDPSRDHTGPSSLRVPIE